MAKIYLSPAAHEHDRQCAFDAKCSENTHCNLYVDELIPYLDACGIEWKRSDKANTGDRYDITIAESNAFAPDIHYVAHTNAFNGTVTGSRLHVYWSDKKSREWGQKVLDWRKKIYPYPVALKDGSALGEVKNTKAVCLYEELVFHDNPQDAAWLHNNLRRMAEYTVRAFCDILGVTFVDPYAKEEPSEPADILYRPQVGAFREKNNADRMAAELKGKGYDTYIVQVDGLYKVQVGAYREKANADRMADKLKADGYSVYISTTGGDAVAEPKPAEPAKPVLRIGAKVRYSGRVYATATGSGAGASVSGEYEVTRYLPERPYGVHIGGLGWVKPGDCTVIG